MPGTPHDCTDRTSKPFCRKVDLEEESMPPRTSRAAPPGYHKHKCKFCTFVWEHHDTNDRGHNASPGSHECPACHRCNWGLGIYDGDEEPRVRNGADPGPGVAALRPDEIHPDQRLRTR
jgi:hypothetical protein